MKKRFSAFLLAALMVAALLPVTSMATTATVSDLAGLKTAIQNGATEITLDGVITVSDVQELSGGDDLVVINTTKTDVFTVNAGGTLTLGNNIKVVSTSSILWANGGTINVAGAVLENTDGASYNLAFAENGGVINMTAGEINGKNNRTTIVVQGANSQFNISGGKATSRIESVLDVKANGSAAISGGTVETAAVDKMNPESAPPAAAFSWNGGTIVVSGGTVKAAAGRAVVTAEAGGGKAEISGGTLIGGSEYGDVYMAEGSGSFVITGGSFTNEIPEGITVNLPAYAGPVMNWVKVNAANNGVVKSGPLAASAGATVTLYPKAAEGYVLDTVEVLDAEGNAVELDGLKFAIPAGGVTVNATFKLAE